MALLILNYDKDDTFYQKKKLGKLSKAKKPLVKVTKEPVLQVVDEKEEEEFKGDEESVLPSDQLHKVDEEDESYLEDE
jgi:hypothetical protein